MNIPIELFIGAVALSAFLAILGFMAHNKKAGMFVVIGGMLMFVMVAITDNHTMGYEQRLSTIDIIPANENTIPIVAGILFNETYTTNSGWTQVGTQVTVDSATADKIDFANAQDATDRRVYKALGVTLSADFRLETVFSRQSGTSIPSHFMTVLSSSNGNPRTANHDMVTITYGNGAYGGSGDCFSLIFKDGAGVIQFIATTEICSSVNQDYYIRLDRVVGNTLDIYTLSVFTDADHTAQIGASKFALVDSDITGFTHIQHSVDSAGGSTRILDGTVDDTIIYDMVTIGGEAGQEIYNYQDAEPILEPFTMESKMWWGAISTILMLLGSLIMRSET